MTYPTVFDFICGNRFDPNDRSAPPPDDEPAFVSRIEVDFKIPVYVTTAQQMAIANLINDLAHAPCNQPKGGTHRLFSHGFKPIYSRSHALLFGKPVDPNAPETDEEALDESTLYFETIAKGPPSDEKQGRGPK